MTTSNDLDRKQTHINPTVTSLEPDYDPSTSPVPSSSRTAVPSSKSLHLIESTRLAVSILVILLGITVLSTSADVVSEYNKTHIPGEFLLPLWGEQDVRGEVAVLVGGAVVVFASGVGLVVEKLYALRNLTTLHKILSFLAPICGLITSIVAVALQYHINTTSKSTLQSWSCQWKSVSMSSSPNFEMICKETKVALYLTILLIPLEVILLGLAGFGVVLKRKVGSMGGFERKG